MARKPSDKKLMKEITEIAFNPEQKTADRLRAMDMLGEMLKEEAKNEEAFAKLDALISLFEE